MKYITSLSSIVILLFLLLCGCSNGTLSETVAPEIENAVSQAILSDNKEGYYGGECPAEGHIIFGTKRENDIIYAYSYIEYACFGFENGNFVDMSGGQMPAVFKFNADNYSLISISYPEDGTNYTSSIKKLFPKKYKSRALNPTDKDFQNLNNQINKYAEDYLNKIGRKAAVGRMDDFEYVLPTDVGVSIEVSNKLTEMAKELSYYPYWIGNQEIIENDIRYVYETKYDKENNQIIYSKYKYDTPEITEERIVINSLNGKIIESSK